MEGLNMSELKNANKDKFNHHTYAQYLKHNPAEAKRYIESFSYPKPIQIEMPKVQSTTPTTEQPSEQSQQQSEAINTVVFSKDDIKELRNVYETKSGGKKAFGGWGWPELVKRINSL